MLISIAFVSCAALSAPGKIELSNIDLECAVQIAGFANLDTRDRRGNLLPDVWIRHSDRMSVGQLLEASDIRTLLTDQLKEQLESQKDMLKELEDNQVMIKWIMDFTHAWESVYRERVQQNFDISQKILSVMQEAYDILKPALEELNINCTEMRQHLRSNKGADSYLNAEEGCMRFFFRNPITCHIFRKVAGKFLQKAEVCNKAGIYSAKIQRHDVTQLRDDALQEAYYYLGFHAEEDQQDKIDLINLIESGNFIGWTMDTRSQDEIRHP